MGAGRWIAAVFGLGLLIASPVSAGIYNPGESEEAATWPDFIGGPPGRNFRDVILTLRGIPVELPQVDNPIRRRYAFAEELLKKYPATSLRTAEDRLQASAVLLRRRKSNDLKFKDAEEVLRPIATQQSELDNIPVQSNFATALHMSGELQKASDTLRDVITRHWEKTSWGELPEERRRFLERIGWHEGLYATYLECDRAYLKLLRLRLREQLTKKTGKGSVQPPDELFDDGQKPATPIRFVTDAGEFTAGKIPDRLPVRALGIVQQLIVWLPDDLRLYWLLGELYNAQRPTEIDKENEKGIRAAERIFLELSKDEPISDEVKRLLQKRVGVLGAAVAAFNEKRDREFDKKFKEIEKKQDEGLPLDWRTVAISFGFGFMLALFVVWQLREIQRRRQARLAKQQSPSL